MRKYPILLFLVFIIVDGAFAQEESQRIWLNGYSRSVLFLDELEVDRDQDTITPSRLNSGHTLVDLSANIKPNESTFINAMVRIRNDYGGFWGSGVTFDLRQLFVRGVIAGAVKYQIGDFDYKMTPFTFYNPYQEFYGNAPEYLSDFYDLTNYDLFLKDEHTRRQQGAALQFGLGFKKVIKELDFDFFVARLRASDFNTMNERISIGAMVDLVQSDYLQLGANYTDILDLKGTSNNDEIFHNPVYSVEGKLTAPIEFMDLNGSFESGASQRYVLNSMNTESLSDWFYKAGIEASLPDRNLSLNLTYREVGPDFRSPGAQTIRNNYTAIPSAYTRVGNAQDVRPVNSLDLMRDPFLINGVIQLDLQEINPFYNNIQPYGEATPNRKGISVNLEKSDKEGAYKIQAFHNNLSEVVGQGTDALRNYNETGLKGQLNAEELLTSYSNKLEVQVFFSQSNTKRDGQEEFENVDLKTSTLDASLRVGVHKNINLILGYRSIDSEGNELLAVRDMNTEVSNFVEVDAELSESMLTYGADFPFGERSKLSLLRQNYSWSNKSTGIQDLKMNTWSILFVMKF